MKAGLLFRLQLYYDRLSVPLTGDSVYDTKQVRNCSRLSVDAARAGLCFRL
jgi:hypothetical protein